jgi:hypothetical protein
MLLKAYLHVKQDRAEPVHQHIFDLFSLGFEWCYRCEGGQNTAERASLRMHFLFLDFPTIVNKSTTYNLFVSISQLHDQNS